MPPLLVTHSRGRTAENLTTCVTIFGFLFSGHFILLQKRLLFVSIFAINTLVVLETVQDVVYETFTFGCEFFFYLLDLRESLLNTYLTPWNVVSFVKSSTFSLSMFWTSLFSVLVLKLQALGSAVVRLSDSSQKEKIRNALATQAPSKYCTDEINSHRRIIAVCSEACKYDIKVIKREAFSWLAHLCVCVRDTFLVLHIPISRQQKFKRVHKNESKFLGGEFLVCLIPSQVFYFDTRGFARSFRICTCKQTGKLAGQYKRKCDNLLLSAAFIFDRQMQKNIKYTRWTVKATNSLFWDLVETIYSLQTCHCRISL